MTRLRTAVGLLFLLSLGGCAPSCNFDFSECDNDFDCGAGEICEYAGSFSAECQSAHLCTSNDSCSDGETCFQREGAPAGNPFESDHPGKKVCECLSGYCGEGGYGGYGGYGGSGGSGAFGGSGGSQSCLGSATPGAVIDAESQGNAESQGGPLFAAGSTGALVGLPFKGTLDVGEGPLVSAGDTDIALLRRDAGGNVLWQRTLGNEGPNPLTALTSWGDGSTFAVATSFTGTIDAGKGPVDSGPGAAALVALLDTSGNTSWTKVLTSDTGVVIHAISQTPTTVIVAGTFEGTLAADGADIFTSAGGTDGFAARFILDTGALDGAVLIGGAGDQYVSNLVTSDSLNVILTGGFEGDTDFDGTALVADGQDAFVARFDNDLAVADWIHVIGGPDRQSVTGFLPQAGGGVAIGVRASTMQSAGSIDLGGGWTFAGAGLVDGFAARIDASGKTQWAQLFFGPPGVGEVTPLAIAVDCAGQLTIGGTAGDMTVVGPAAGLPSHGKLDAFLAKLEGNGDYRWAQLFGGPDNDAVTSVLAVDSPEVIDTGMELLVGGTYQGVVEIGSATLVSQGAEDAFVVRVAP